MMSLKPSGLSDALAVLRSWDGQPDASASSRVTSTPPRAALAAAAAVREERHARYRDEIQVAEDRRGRVQAPRPPKVRADRSAGGGKPAQEARPLPPPKKPSVPPPVESMLPQPPSPPLANGRPGGRKLRRLSAVPNYSDEWSPSSEEVQETQPPPLPKRPLPPQQPIDSTPALPSQPPSDSTKPPPPPPPADSTLAPLSQPPADSMLAPLPQPPSPPLANGRSTGARKLRRLSAVPNYSDDWRDLALPGDEELGERATSREAPPKQSRRRTKQAPTPLTVDRVS